LTGKKTGRTIKGRRKWKRWKEVEKRDGKRWKEMEKNGMVTEMRKGGK
jgi:hypothetical protein